MYINELLWYYHRLFSRNEDLYSENYDVIAFGRTLENTRLSSKGWDFINSSYHEITHVYNVIISKESFKDYVVKGVSNPYKIYNKKFRYNKYRHEKSTHYIRNKNHEKKVISEKMQAKKDWIKKKGIDKDKRKCRYSRSSGGKSWKRISNKMNRAWQKNMIFNEQWESMSNLDYKFFIDPWMWD